MNKNATEAPNVLACTLLAKLRPDEKQKSWEEDMKALVAFAGHMSAPEAQSFSKERVRTLSELRADEPEEIAYSRAELLQNAPTHDEEFLFVPRVVSEEGVGEG